MFGNLYAAVTLWCNAIWCLSTVPGTKLLKPLGFPKWQVRRTSPFLLTESLLLMGPSGDAGWPPEEPARPESWHCRSGPPSRRGGGPGDSSLPPRQGTEPPGAQGAPQAGGGSPPTARGQEPCLRPSVPGVYCRSTVTLWDGNPGLPWVLGAAGANHRTSYKGVQVRQKVGDGGHPQPASGVWGGGQPAGLTPRPPESALTLLRVRTAAREGKAHMFGVRSTVSRGDHFLCCNV